MTAPNATEREIAREIDHAAVWRVLHECCRAHEEMPHDFAHHWPACREYRFMGALGFGGKIWSNSKRWYVTCYAEDETPTRLAMIAEANHRLSVLRTMED